MSALFFTICDDGKASTMPLMLCGLIRGIEKVPERFFSDRILSQFSYDSALLIIVALHIPARGGLKEC
ncbi:MAG: hypothetical protein ICV78_08510 [Tolypothrix sp. Co-bin9]|nr:hypothetical protein [Tolypothrix sp. Co-bin9]